ncbi:hypothetical protein BD626DRAFT_31977 [Schizophyllum amplum]|uniref:Uncharacterized protein n=1 Tax=Schizophyllum amplum TaxID=97359 RepID=A0A550D0U5_9AGAR|nr:hypothetical protein BD626DRAFT_31977 [Auriculariopsis ampla]
MIALWDLRAHGCLTPHISARHRQICTIGRHALPRARLHKKVQEQLHRRTRTPTTNRLQRPLSGVKHPPTGARILVPARPFPTTLLPPRISPFSSPPLFRCLSLLPASEPTSTRRDARAWPSRCCRIVLGCSCTSSERPAHRGAPAACSIYSWSECASRVARPRQSLRAASAGCTGSAGGTVHGLDWREARARTRAVASGGGRCWDALARGAARGGGKRREE